MFPCLSRKRISCVASSALFAAAVVGTATSAQAAVITAISAANTPTVVNSIPVAGTGDLGYYIFGMLPADVTNNYTNVSLPVTSGNSTNAGINGLPSWATVSFSDAANTFIKTTDSTLTVNGTSYTTAFHFATSTITLGIGTPAAFRLGMVSNTGDPGWDLTVSSPAVLPTSTATIQNRYLAGMENDFYYFSVTDAAVGDTIDLSSGGGNYGGFTLASEVPEPASLGLFGLVAISILAKRRRQL